MDAADEGTVIAVCPGLYEENVDVGESVTIHSVEGPEETTVQAERSDDHVFHVQKGDTTIEGFTIRGATGSGRGGVYVQGGAVRGAGPQDSVEGTKILDNSVTDNHYGIYLFEAEATEIAETYVFDNAASGLMLKSSVESQIADNHIYSNGGNGITLEQCQEESGKETAITQNAIRDNGQHGIGLLQARGIRIADSLTISDNSLDGVFMEDSEAIQLVGTTSIRNNVRDGVGVHNSQVSDAEKTIVVLRNTIEGSKSSGKQQNGISLVNSTGVRIGGPGDGNTITNHPQNGIYLQNCHAGSSPGAAIQILGNTVQWNEQAGITLKSSCGTVVASTNTVNENGDGIRIDTCQCANSTPNEVTASTIESNHKHGVYVESSCGNHIGKQGQGNTIKLNGEHGIQLKTCDCSSEINRIAGNTIQENSKHGVHLHESSHCEITDDNHIGPGNQHGVYMEWSGSNVVKENAIDDNEKNGVHIVWSQGSNEMDGNEINDHVDGIYLYGGKEAGAGVEEIVGNTIHNNTRGIHLQHFCQARIWSGPTYDWDNRNSIESNEVGIYLERCLCSATDYNQIASNLIRDNSRGIDVRSSMETKIVEKNIIRENAEAGIYVFDSSKTDIHGENVIGPDNGNGIALYQCQAASDAPNEIRGNVIRDNHKHGVYLERSYGTAVGDDDEGNEVYANTQDGIHTKHCRSSAQSPVNRIVGNTVGPNNNDGISLDHSNDHEVAGNDVSQNKKDGIHLERSTDNKIHENKPVSDNKWNGIYLKWSQENEIAGNEVTENDLSGVCLYESHGNQIWELDETPNRVTHNGEHGVRLDVSHRNVLRDNEITDNEKDGIRINRGRRNEILGEHTIKDNDKNGIRLSGAVSTLIAGPRPKIRNKGVHYTALIQGNGENGIHYNYASNNTLRYYKINGQTTGILLEYSHHNRFDSNWITLNGLGVEENCSSDNNYGASWFIFNGHTIIIEGCSTTTSTIVGCTLKGSDADAITCSNGAVPTVRKSNIYDNDGVGVNNLDPSVTVDARDNWWGHPSGPGGAGPGSGDEISGTVDFADWRTISVTLVAIADRDPVLAARGTTAANQIEIYNWEVPTDTVTVGLTDSLTWLTDPNTFTVTLEGNAATVPVTFTVPAETALHTTDEVTVTVRSGTDPSITDTTTFRATAARVADLTVNKVSPESVFEGAIAHIIVVTNAGPDDATGVIITDTLPVTATVISATPSVGTCAEQPGAVACTIGTMTSGAQASVTLVARANDDRGLHDTAEVSADEHDPDPSGNFDWAFTTVLTSCLNPLQDVAIVGPVSGYTETSHAFTTVISPTDATAPITYTWAPEPDSGQGKTSAIYQWTALGTYSITVSARNCGGTVSETQLIAIIVEPRHRIYLPLVLRLLGSAAADEAPTMAVTGHPLTDQTGTITERVRRGPLVAPTYSHGAAESALGNTYLFRGRPFEFEVGLYMSGRSRYEPTAGGYIQRRAGSLPNPRTFARNNRPSGLASR